MDRGPAQISRLHEDILHYIFELNADMYLEGKSNSSDDYHQTSSDPNDSALNDSALNVIRHTSQVCRYWRGLIISSPTIWGNIIDLNHLRQANNLWQKEVIRRTGKSNLSVKGAVRCREPESTFFADLLKHHWQRIRKLDVKIHDYQLLDCEAWKALQRPAPHLEILKVDLMEWDSLQIFPTSDPPLFSDKAPSLREFRFTYPPGINANFTLRAPWLHQLRDVTLIETFTISDILDALVDMLLLESLELQNATVGAAVPRRCVRLPRLSLMTINTITGLRAALLFLERVVAAPACALVLDTSDGANSDVTMEDITALQKIILRYGSEYFRSTTMEGFTFSHHPKSFSLHYPPLKTSATRRKQPAFGVDIFLDFPVTPGFFGGLQNSLSPSCFNYIKIWNMHDDRFADLEWDISNAGWDGLASFFSLFPFVEILQAPYYSLRVLLAAFQENPCLWSLLHTLRITDYTILTPSVADTLLRFLDRREGVELPMKVLDVTEWVAQEHQDWGFLERKAGLKVVWVRDGNPSSYICGTGEPETLKI